MVGRVVAQLEGHVKDKSCQYVGGTVAGKSIMYLGHFIDESGIRPAEGKMKAIMECPSPENIQQLKSFLEQESAFCRSKELLLNSNVLTFYQPQLPLVLITDASPYGVGAVLCHVIDGVEKPIWCASATLTPAEKNYAQIEREALAIVFGVRRFHKFLYGQQFTIVTDAQVLKRILGPKVGIPTLAASRLQRWALILASYDYEVVYRKNVENADMLSRLPLPMESTGDEECIFQMEGPLNNEDIIVQSKADKVLQKVIHFTQAGWPKCCEEGLKPYFVRRHELTVSEGCLCWGNRVVVPRVLRGKVLQMLHEQHIGIVRMKLLARQTIWWPGVEKDIEDVIVNCETCLVTQTRVSQQKYLVPWSETMQPWERVHLDLLSFQGHHILVLVDSYSKWMEAWLMEGTSAQKVILKLREFMAVFGIPQEIVSDNGPPFQSVEFTLFCKQNNIKVTKSPPYHPQSNGLAERGVRTIKENLAKQYIDMLNSHLRGDLVNQSKPVIEHHLLNFLISYRNTPCSVTTVSPASLIFKHQPRTTLSLLKPVRPQKQQVPKSTPRAVCKGQTIPEFRLHEEVLVRNPNPGAFKYIKGQIVAVMSKATFKVTLPNGVRLVHLDQLRKLRDTQPKIELNKANHRAWDDFMWSAKKYDPNSQCREPGRDVTTGREF
ncbi:uncharacterized protein K02A2.6-like [Ischnura elegans]|uniref:uncharacterized protein K02A2.6-like n=1 Tax=Ischnura elegans TaxID=197161 RepID=UPI001ED894FB|nr:uncharacterized protein K02A2.6-like [Ischnura elegans]